MFIKVKNIDFEIGVVKDEFNKDFDITVIFCDKFVESRELVNWHYGAFDLNNSIEYINDWIKSKNILVD